MRNILPTFFFLEREKKEKMKFNGRRTGIPNIFPEEKSDFLIIQNHDEAITIITRLLTMSTVGL